MHNFVLSHTSLTTLPFLDGMRLHLAEEVVPVWEDSERDAPPFWAFAWAGGQALARYILSNPALVAGKRVLDLACGSGMVAIAAARCGAVSVVANDIDGYAMQATTLNADANEAKVEFELGDLLSSRYDTDVVLAGDIFYSREMSGRMLSFLDNCTASLVLVGDPGRAYAPRTGFVTVAEYDVPVNADVEDTQLKRSRVLQRS
jgi:predicted nicotinamide N-methyase